MKFEADILTDLSRVVFLIKDPTNLVDDYCNRPDHLGFNDFINSTINVENAKLICNATLKDINVERCRQIKNSQYFWIERNDNSTVEETIHKVEQHFRW